MAQDVRRQIFVNAGPIAHFANGDLNAPLVGDDMHSDMQLHPAGMGFVVESGIFVNFASSEEITAEYSNGSIIDLQGKAVIPGFVDAHTHLLWSGDRSAEMRMRQQGMSYKDIAAAGGGIRYTVEETRECKNFDQIAEHRIHQSISLGTTSIEVKSGYGLDTETELRMLESYSRMRTKFPGLSIHITWMGAHDIPNGFERKQYVESLLTEQLPSVLKQGHANSVDVFCEPGWFTLSDTEDICKDAINGGLNVRLHVDEFVDGCGLALAAELGARTADHALHSNDDAREAASKAGTVQGFLPGTPYVLGNDNWPPANHCTENQWAWSLASDFNPNCQSLSIPMVGSLATHRMGVDPIAALAASTRNPATTLTDEKLIDGIISVGAKANFNVLHSGLIESWCQTPGQSPIFETYIMGERY